ncbi:hypothetical protein MMB232_00268 [Brevundimonas subvibrioides]|uniref:response regulator n=1 Tax=Brevundimonas subvibrioides TaxID=74313 RepID=UPI0032D57AAD
MSDTADSARTADEAAIAEMDRHRLEVLLERYDGLIRDGRRPGPSEAAELSAMAGIFDLDPRRPFEAVWPDLRAILTAQAPRVPDEVASFAPSDGLTLMIVEDDPAMAQDLTALMVEAGHAVVGPFHSAEAAEAAAALHSIDVALLDINLSGEGDGATLGRRLKTRWGTRVVFLSGNVTAAARHADIAEAIVIKPYRAADVLGAIQRAVPGRSGQGRA